MKPSPSCHPVAEQLTAFDQGYLGPAEWSEVAEHVSRCDRCCSFLDSLPIDSFAEFMRSAVQPLEGEKRGESLKTVEESQPFIRWAPNEPTWPRRH